MKTRLFLSAPALLAILISGCATAPDATRDRGAFAPLVEIDASMTPRQQLAQWLQQADAEPSPRREQYLLQAGELLLREYQTDVAEELLQSIDPSGLPPEQVLHHALLSSRILRGRGQFQAALELLNDEHLNEQSLYASVFRQVQLSQMRASLHSLEGQHLASVQERIYIDPLLRPEQQRINREGIWHSLQYVPTEELLRHHHSASNRDYLGWLELASIAKDNQGNLDAQLTQLRHWQQRWSDHPAAASLPGGLGELETLARQRPSQVALLLPVTGRLASYGKAIRDGFLASHYQTQASGGLVPLLRVYDSAQHANIGATYRQAVADGAKMVIGPLTKEAVAALLEQVPQLEVPTLALNRIDGNQFPGMLFQFGLAPEDEARQLAQIANGEGYRRTLALIPEGSWGENVADSFAEHWRQLGGDVVGRSRFDAATKNYSKVIQSALQLDRSEQRASLLRQITGKRFEFEPRRRGDADFIFLVARPHEAQAIKPLLAYHYAGDLPVYATSHVYNGIPEPDKNRDIDGIKFVHIPWVLNEVTPERRGILDELPQSGAYQRMYALGVDSYRLFPRLRQLTSLQNSRVFGETGSLQLNPLRQIERELLLAEFSNGKAKNIPITDASLDKDIQGETTPAAEQTP